MWDKIKSMAKAVYDYIASRPADTWLHVFVLGMIPSLTIGLLSGNFWCAMTIGVFLAAWKEWYDRRHPEEHTAEWRDFINTIIGAVLGSLVVFFG